MSEAKEALQQLKEHYDQIRASIDIAQKETRLKELVAESSVEGLWDDPNTAKDIMQELGDLQKEVDEIKGLEEEINSLLELADDKDFQKELKKEVGALSKRVARLEISSFLSGPYDKNNAIISVHSGQGGTEAMDWAHMLYRMYTRYFERKGWSYEILEMTAGEEAGIKAVVIRVEGEYVYGYLKHEAGTHRLVRQSPFNADSLRQTSFSLVEVLPELKETDASDIVLKEEDLEWQFYRSSGAGGQNVNKVSTAVRLIHIPTGIVVTSQTQRQQQQNRNNALALLRSKLWILEQEKAKNKIENIKGEYRPASWGTQIRSYVLHPYKMVKDLRTEYETSDPVAILDGDLDEMIDTEVRMLVS